MTDLIAMILLLTLDWAYLVFGFPLETKFNQSTNTVGWVSGPSYRSTMSIISSCVLTMGLCVWSALHLNIPPAREAVTQYWMRIIKWVLVGILAPELVVFTA